MARIVKACLAEDEDAVLSCQSVDAIGTKSWTKAVLLTFVMASLTSANTSGGTGFEKSIPVTSAPNVGASGVA